MHDDLCQDPIPYDWTADQALAVVEFLEALAELIWSRYGFAIREYFPRPGPLAQPPQLSLPFPPLWEYNIDLHNDGADYDIPW